MKSGTLNTVISAVVGGVVGAVVAFACGAFSAKGVSESAIPETIDKLKVRELIVSDKMMLWEDGKEDASLLMQNGGILAKTRVIATQFCGNTVTANALLTTPDNPLKPLQECEFYTEMASSKNEGGMLTVRSPDGGNILGNPNGIQSGTAFTITYDPQSNPVCFFRKNDTGERLLGHYLWLPAGQNGTIAIQTPSAPPQQPGTPGDMPQNASAGASMTPNLSVPLPNGTTTQPAPIPPGEQSAMYPPMSRQ